MLANFAPAVARTIEDSYRKQLPVDDQTWLLDVLDTAGMEEFSAMRDQYMRQAQAVMYVYSVTSSRSLDELASIHEQLLRVRDEDPASSTFPVVICGNKIDLESERQVTTKDGADLATRWRAEFFETSAKTRINIDEAFVALVRLFARNRQKPASDNKHREQGERKARKCTLL